VWLIALVTGVISIVEAAFLLANVFKIPHGGWFPLVVGVVILSLFTTWKTGRALVSARIQSDRRPLTDFVRDVAAAPSQEVARVPGTAVFMHRNAGVTPPGIAALVRAVGALHEEVFVVSVAGAESPRVVPARRVKTTDLGHGFHQVELCYGFMDATPVADDLAAHLRLEPESTDYFLGRETVRPTDRPGMARWREVLYVLMVRNATDAATYFDLPEDRVIEIGLRVDI
jgi:KUP system potassium uptake protein